MMYRKISLFAALLCIMFSASAQIFKSTDKAVFKARVPGYYQTVILPSIQEEVKQYEHRNFSMEFSEEFPVDVTKYRQIWHTMPKSQGNTGTCWCFAATSFVESEIFRQTKKSMDLSEMYFVYWEYVDRAKDFVRTRGETYFEQGSEANALKRLMPVYGCVPDEIYKGKPEYREFHSHKEMLKEMKDFLQGVKSRGEWNENNVVSGIRSILDSHMGEVPDNFTYEGQKFTPVSFYESLDVEVRDMFSFMSTLSQPMNQKAELVEPDNWWQSDDYYNVSLNDYCDLINVALEQGYSICICGDVSEPGYDSFEEVGIVPDFDIPSDYINEYSREMRLNNGSTTDDHCIQLVGYQNVNGEMWYLVKDSGAGGFDGKNKGYRFYHEDYIRLKMMNIMLHKDAAREILDGIIK